MEPIFEGEALAEVGREAARAAWEGGMTVLRPDGTVVPIPLVAEPELLPRAELRGRRARGGAHPLGVREARPGAPRPRRRA